MLIEVFILSTVLQYAAYTGTIVTFTVVLFYGVEEARS
jgi:hypothetical protein